MLLKYFYDHALAHASYMVGCQKTNEALIIDPGRDITPYLETAAKEGMHIIGVAETHIHADFVSGARELAEQQEATLYLSDEGPSDWKYLYADNYNTQFLKDGDSFMVGNVKLETMHTPGHTPESISFLLTDMGGGADKPMGIFTGDFVFVGSIGRPDLLEKAAGVVGTADSGARELFHSVKRFKKLPDYLQVWPAHGAGSACGKDLGAIPSSTVGYEKLFNPALTYSQEQAFVDYVLADQPEPPKYFAVMKQVNKEGPTLLGQAPLPTKLTTDTLTATVATNALILDTREAPDFAAAHVPGTINTPMWSLAHWAGWFIAYDKPVYLITTAQQLAEATRILRKIGVDKLAGYFEADSVAQAKYNTQSYQVSSPTELADDILKGNITLIDVRNAAEWDAGHLPNAQHHFLGTLMETAASINGNPVVVQCQTGRRSAIGASILQAAGVKHVINMAGGFSQWAADGLPIVD